MRRSPHLAEWDSSDDSTKAEGRFRESQKPEETLGHRIGPKVAALSPRFVDSCRTFELVGNAGSAARSIRAPGRIYRCPSFGAGRLSVLGGGAGREGGGAWGATSRSCIGPAGLPERMFCSCWGSSGRPGCCAYAGWCAVNGKSRAGGGVRLITGGGALAGRL